MNLNPQELATFFNLGVDGWEQGITMVCKRFAEKAVTALATVSPEDSPGIARQQERYQIFAKELPGMLQQISVFRAEQAQALGKP